MLSVVPVKVLGSFIHFEISHRRSACNIDLHEILVSQTEVDLLLQRTVCHRCLSRWTSRGYPAVDRTNVEIDIIVAADTLSTARSGYMLTRTVIGRSFSPSMVPVEISRSMKSAVQNIMVDGEVVGLITEEHSNVRAILYQIRGRGWSVLPGLLPGGFP